MTVKTRVINAIIEREGGFVDDPDDSGGATNYGVTEAVAREHGYTGPMRDMPRRVAVEIYTGRYWSAVRGDELAQLSERIADEVADTAVNMGPARAGQFLQRALNALNDRERLYGDLVLDGAIGPATVGALAQYLQHRSELVLCKALNCLQGAFYIELAERRQKDERFLYGWLRERVTL